ncbi:MAG: OmpH family outer membrane protein [Nitrosomonas sp.]|nr:OmpH family outer membrane protein [Nitrosomonas sp.]
MDLTLRWWKFHYYIVMAILLLPVNALSDLHADNIRIGVVNTEKILRESTPALKAQQKIDQEFFPRDAEIKDMAKQAKTLQEKLEQKGATMNDADRRELERELANLSRNYQRAQRQMREDLTVRQNEEYGVILELIDEAINTVAEKENYDLILQLQDSVYRSQRIDITDQVIKVLNKTNSRNKNAH